MAKNGNNGNNGARGRYYDDYDDYGRGRGGRRGSRGGDADLAQMFLDFMKQAVFEAGAHYVTNVTNEYTTALHESVSIMRAAVTFSNAQFEASMKRASAVIENALSITVEGFTKTANEIGIDALRSRMAMAKANVEAKKTELIAQKQFEIDRTRALQNVAQVSLNTIKQAAYDTIQLTKYGTELSDKAIGELVDYARENFGENSQAIISALGGIAEATNSFSRFGLEIEGLGTALTATVAGEQMKYNLDRMELEKDMLERATSQFESFLSQGEKVVGKFLDLADNVQKSVGAADKAARMQGVLMGYYGKQGDAFAKGIMSVTERVAETFGKKAEELMAMQKSYIEASGRNVQMSAGDYENMLSIGRAFGMGDTEVAQMFGDMNVFNTSVDSGTDMIREMYGTVTKMGLSTAKFGKELVNNLKLAQKYNFKGGLDNMMKMTQWAMQTRFNLSSATSFADKIAEGGISELLETSAKLQVLGGSSAIYSDPLAMLYEAGADVGQLAKRQAAMFNDIKGTFNAETGETEFSWFEDQMIRLRAKAAGLDAGDVRNMIRQNQRQGVVDQELKGLGLDPETRTALSNRATFNAKNKRWEVTDLKGNTYDLKTAASNKKILESIMPENRDDAMLSIAQKSLGFSERQTNYQAWLVAHFGAKNYESIVDVSNRMLEQEKAYYEKADENISNNMGYVYEKAAEAQQQQYETELANQEAYNEILRNHIDISNKLAMVTEADMNTLRDTGNKLNAVMQDAGGGIGYFYDQIKRQMEASSVNTIALLESARSYMADVAEDSVTGQMMRDILDVQLQKAYETFGFAQEFKKKSGEVYSHSGAVKGGAAAVSNTPKSFFGSIGNAAKFVWNGGKSIFTGNSGTLSGGNGSISAGTGGFAFPQTYSYAAQTGTYNGYGVSVTPSASYGNYAQSSGSYTPSTSYNFSTTNIEGDLRSISSDVTKIANAVSGGRGNGVNVNNNISVSSTLTNEDVKRAIIHAINTDSSFAISLNKALSATGTSLYSMNGANRQ